MIDGYEGLEDVLSFRCREFFVKSCIELLCLYECHTLLILVQRNNSLFA